MMVSTIGAVAPILVLPVACAWAAKSFGSGAILTIRQVVSFIPGKVVHIPVLDFHTVLGSWIFEH